MKGDLTILTLYFTLLYITYIPTPSTTMKRNKKRQITLDDYIKAIKIGNREAEKEMFGPGFHATHRVHRSSKTYTRKIKHKGQDIQ